LKLADALLNEVIPLTRVDIPEALRWKANALIGLGKFDKAHRILTEAHSLAKGLDAKPQLWPILASLQIVNSKLGKDKEAATNREEARAIIQQIADSLHEIRLSESFLNQPRIQNMMHNYKTPFQN